MGKFLFLLFGTGYTKIDGKQNVVSVLLQVLIALVMIGVPLSIILNVAIPGFYASFGIGSKQQVCMYRPELARCKE